MNCIKVCLDTPLCGGSFVENVSVKKLEKMGCHFQVESKVFAMRLNVIHTR